MDIGGWVTTFARHLFPPACPLCRKNLSAADRFFCPDCLAGFVSLPAAHCPRCALPFAGRDNSSHLCGRCSSAAPPFQKVYALGLYEQRLREAIQQFKFSQAVSLDRPLARLLNTALGTDLPVDLIVPVPLYVKRLRQRSYNQSLLLARELSRLRGIPVTGNLLQKCQDTLPQQGLGARERERNLSRSFTLSQPLSGEKVLLVDDVMTTGATVAACSKCLLQGGADAVQVAILARAPLESMAES